MPRKDREEARAYAKRYYDAHAEERRAYQRHYNATHSAKRRANPGYYWAHREERLAYAAAHSKRINRHTTDHEIRVLGERLNLDTMPPPLRELGLLLKTARRAIKESKTGALA